MKLDIHKELTPVIFNENSIKMIPTRAESEIQLFPPHWHERLEFLLVEEGSLTVNFSNRSVEYMPGDIAIFCPKQLHHGISGKNGVKYLCLMLDLSAFITDSSATVRYIEPIHNGKILFSNHCSNEEFAEAIRDIARLTKIKTPENSLMIQGRIYSILGLLYKCCSISEKNDNAPDTKFSNIIKYIDTHYSEQLNTRNLSEKFGYDESYFCRKFKSTTGLPVMKYIKILRLEQAQRLLKVSNDNVHQIATLCGFADHCYFTRSFHDYYKCTPSEFRTKCREEKEEQERFKEKVKQ